MTSSVRFAIIIAAVPATFLISIATADMEVMIIIVNNLMQKTQSAIAVLIPGIVLMAVGYSVDASTGAYAGDLTRLPNMVNGLTLIITLIPFIVSTLSWVIYKFAYPITPEFRKTMTDELEKRHAEAQKNIES